MTIHVVIVTYNRKTLLCRCLEAVLKQTAIIDKIIIVDNASTDGTKAFLEEKGFLLRGSSRESNPTHSNAIQYIKLEKNTGGAGGFFAGMQYAHNDGADLVWIMDDDGFPHETCLKKQLEFVGRYEYIMPISLSTENPDDLTWFVRCKNRKLTRSYSELKNSFSDGIMRHAVPFNGLLVTRGVIDKVGFPKKEMFIWGDDFEYQYRCEENDITPVTILDAVFFHPEDKATCYRVFLGLIPLIYTESKLRFTCLIRNSTYNYWNYKGKYIIIIKFFLYSWLFMVEKRCALRDYWYYLLCVKDGITGNFKRHLDLIE